MRQAAIDSNDRRSIIKRSHLRNKAGNKATLHNCLKHGPATQNRNNHSDFRAHLDGHIGWVEQLNPRRGHRLRTLFNQIAWV
jgi:hypothetical protein